MNGNRVQCMNGNRLLITVRPLKNKMMAFVNFDDNIRRDKYMLLAKEERSRLSEGLRDPKSQWSVLAAMLNKDRNRYSDVVPYESSRVKLHVTDESSDYINASYINVDLSKSAKSQNLSCGGLARYIASQGPTISTADHFWHMAYQQTQLDTIIIIMVTPLFERGHEKCYKYWPNGTLEVGSGGLFEYGLTIKNKRGPSIEQIHDDIEISEFEVIPSNGLPSKRCFHFYYKGWADFSAPTSLDPLLRLSTCVNKLKAESAQSKDDPTIIHCSAGVGRTGTYISIDYLFTKLLNHIDFSPKVIQSSISDKREDLKTPYTDLSKVWDPIFEIVNQQRHQRVMMVQRYEQYCFLYKCVKEYFMSEYSRKKDQL